jgi:hypothetical protein
MSLPTTYLLNMLENEDRRVLSLGSIATVVEGLNLPDKTIGLTFLILEPTLNTRIISSVVI